MRSEKSFSKLVMFTVAVSFIESIFLISFIWLGINIRIHGLSLALYEMHTIDLEFYLYILLFSFLATSIFLISVTIPNSVKFKKYSGFLSWLFLIAIFSFIGYLFYITEIAGK